METSSLPLPPPPQQIKEVEKKVNAPYYDYHSIISGSSGMLPPKGSKVPSDLANFLNSKEVVVANGKKQQPPVISVVAKEGVNYCDDTVLLIERQDVVVITGASGSAKSHFMASILANIWNPQNNDLDRLGLLYEPMPSDKYILYLDTEMSQTQSSRRIEKICARCGLPSDYKDEHFFYYNLRDTEYKGNLLVLSWICLMLNEKTGKTPYAIFVDGSLDFVQNPRDDNQAQLFNNLLLQICDDYDCTIFAIIHKSDKSEGGTPLGTVGSYLQRRASCILDITKDKSNGTYHVECKKLREGGEYAVPTLSFRFNEKGFPVTADGSGASIATSKSEKRVSDLKIVFEKIYVVPGQILNKVELLAKYRNITSVSERQARDRLRDAEHNNIIVETFPKSKDYKLSDYAPPSQFIPYENLIGQEYDDNPPF